MRVSFSDEDEYESTKSFAIFINELNKTDRYIMFSRKTSFNEATSSRKENTISGHVFLKIMWFSAEYE